MVKIFQTNRLEIGGVGSFTKSSVCLSAKSLYARYSILLDEPLNHKVKHVHCGLLDNPCVFESVPFPILNEKLQSSGCPV